MPDIIKLLPDSIANQIAAGEVIQRPASVVKELLENSIDAGATRIQLIIKDAGKTLIQIIDNGAGMSETDARMAFERHATSKIKKSEDLESIRTMGFRGEALASIAAVAQVELKTRLHDQDLGTKISIAGSKFIKQEPAQTSGGTNFAVSNLFFNTPARRKFLKSDPVELKNIIEEFEHIAIAYPEIEMSCINNDQELYILPKGNLKQRVIGVFGKSIAEKIIAIEEQTEVVQIGGFIGKADATKKKRGDQYLYVNRRFIKSTYLHHAIKAAYDSLIAEEDHPFYVLFLDIDPTRIDVNIHPSKHEIKFLDERIIYQYLRVASRHALGQYVPPTLDFEATDRGISDKIMTFNTDVKKTVLSGNAYTESYIPKEPLSQDWKKYYEILKNKPDTSFSGDPQAILLSSNLNKESETIATSDSIHTFASKLNEVTDADPFQLHTKYIVYPTPSGMMIIDQQAAHQRIIYDQALKNLSGTGVASQRTLFPTTIQMSGSDQQILLSLLPELNRLGFDLESFGTANFIVHGTPMDWPEKQSVHEFIDKLIRECANDVDQKINYKTVLARQYAKYKSIKSGERLSIHEMKHIINEIQLSNDGALGVFGGRTWVVLELDELSKRFKST